MTITKFAPSSRLSAYIREYIIIESDAGINSTIIPDETVQAAYKKEVFDIQAMLKRLNITIDREIYQPVANH